MDKPKISWVVILLAILLFGRVADAQPAVGGFSPGSGAVGTRVFITGSNLLTATQVTFNGVPATLFSVASNGTSIFADVPATATTGPISVTTSGGTATSVNDFVVSDVPAVGGFSPGSGAVGTRVFITGSNLLTATQVTFNGVPATSFSVASNGTSIFADVPATATTGPISVTTSGGTATSVNDFVVSDVPAVGGFSPGSGAVGTRVFITGSNLLTATQVTFNGVPATSFSVASNGTSIFADVPATATTGPISVTTSGGTATSVNDFVVSDVPAVGGFSPGSGAVGTRVFITGSNLLTATQVTFNGVPATSFSVASNGTSIFADVPATATTGSISVTTSGGTATSANDFVVSDVPAVGGFSPGSGAVGTRVFITGSNLLTATQVTFNGVPATSFSVASNGTSIFADVPATATTGSIRVTTSGGTATSVNDFVVVDTDLTGPVITPTVSGVLGTNVSSGAIFGWFTSAVTVSWTVVDNESTISQQINCGTTAIVGDTGPSGVTITCTAMSSGGVSSKTVTVLKDGSAPLIQIVNPTVTTYTLNEQVPVNYTCTDGPSGVHLCTGSVATGQLLATSLVGTHTFEVSAVDAAGNARSQSVQYTVAYKICPRFDQDRAVRRGATIPIRLQLCDVANVNHSSNFIPVSATAVRFVSGYVGESELLNAGNSNPDLNFRYDMSLNGYIFNLKTEGLATGTWQLIFAAGSQPTQYSIAFQVR